MITWDATLSVDPVVTDGESGKSFGRYHYSNNSPYVFVDPDGREVRAIYNLRTNVLSVRDVEKNISLEVKAESGGKPWGDPIPPGSYDILGHPDPDFFRLEPVDAHYGDDTRDSDGRDKFRLHRPGRTIGCVAVCEPDDWRSIEQLIHATRAATAEVLSKSRNPFRKKNTETIPWYGNLVVIKGKVTITVTPPKPVEKPEEKPKPETPKQQ
jgi:hypothetical protein